MDAIDIQAEKRKSRKAIIWASIDKAMCFIKLPTGEQLSRHKFPHGVGLPEGAVIEYAYVSKEMLIAECCRDLGACRRTILEYLNEMILMEEIIEEDGKLYTQEGWKAELIFRELDKDRKPDFVRIPPSKWEVQDTL